MDFNENHEMNYEDLSIADLISFIYKSYKSYLSHEIKDLDINPGQIPFIKRLKITENVSQDDLANHLSLSRGTAAKTLRKLDDEKIVERRVAMDNRRKYEVFLTSHGKEIALELEKIDKKWEAMIYKNIDGKDKEEFMRVLKILAFNSMENFIDARDHMRRYSFKNHRNKMKMKNIMNNEVVSDFRSFRDFKR